MTLYQRISPVYEAGKGLKDEFIVSRAVLRNGEGWLCFIIGNQPGVILTNTATGERSVVSQEEFEREFREVESHD